MNSASRSHHGVRRKILIVDDDNVRVKALRRILAAGGYQVRHAENGEEGLNVLQAEAPTIVLLDAVLPGMSGFEVCRRIKSNPVLQGTIVVMLSARLSDPDRQADGIEAGADDYIPWPTTQRGLLARLGLAARAADRRSPVPVDSPLTRRQREVASLVASGLTCRAIAARLCISVRTAETHRAMIMRRLQLHTTAELVRYALDHGLAG